MKLALQVTLDAASVRIRHFEGTPMQELTKKMLIEAMSRSKQGPGGFRTPLPCSGTLPRFRKVR